MAKTNRNKVLLERRKVAIRKKLSGTTERPRLRVTRSLKHIYAQIIDDSAGKTLAAASSVSLKIAGGNVESAKAVGKANRREGQRNNIECVCFDRGGCLYHGG